MSDPFRRVSSRRLPPFPGQQNPKFWNKTGVREVSSTGGSGVAIYPTRMTESKEYFLESMNLTFLRH